GPVFPTFRRPCCRTNARILSRSPRSRCDQQRRAHHSLCADRPPRSTSRPASECRSRPSFYCPWVVGIHLRPRPRSRTRAANCHKAESVEVSKSFSQSEERRYRVEHNQQSAISNEWSVIGSQRSLVRFISESD